MPEFSATTIKGSDRASDIDTKVLDVADGIWGMFVRAATSNEEPSDGLSFDFAPFDWESVSGGDYFTMLRLVGATDLTNGIRIRDASGSTPGEYRIYVDQDYQIGTSDAEPAIVIAKWLGTATDIDDTDNVDFDNPTYWEDVFAVNATTIWHKELGDLADGTGVSTVTGTAPISAVTSAEKDVTVSIDVSTALSGQVLSPNGLGGVQWYDPTVAVCGNFSLANSLLTISDSVAFPELSLAQFERGDIALADNGQIDIPTSGTYLVTMDLRISREISTYPTGIEGAGLEIAVVATGGSQLGVNQFATFSYDEDINGDTHYRTKGGGSVSAICSLNGTQYIYPTVRFLDSGFAGGVEVYVDVNVTVVSLSL